MELKMIDWLHCRDSIAVNASQRRPHYVFATNHSS